MITAGDPVMLIVPEADSLLVEAKVEPRDIDQVQIGQPVVLRFSAFNTRTTPELNGTVVRVGADTSTDQRTGQNYYLVRISMTKDEIERLGDVKLPGAERDKLPAGCYNYLDVARSEHRGSAA